jgi:GTPase SAR1 family protein
MHCLNLLLLVFNLLLSISSANGWLLLDIGAQKQSSKSFQLWMATLPEPGTGCIASDDYNIATSKIMHSCYRKTVDFNQVEVGVRSKSDNVMLSDSNTSTRMSDCGAWMTRYYDLLQFHKTHEHTIVPKRYKNNPTLGNWVNKQRQHYRNFIQNQKPCSLTTERIDLLNNIQFCWDASNVSKASGITTILDETKHLNDEEWWNQYNQLKALLQTHSLSNETKSDDNTLYRPIHYMNRYNSTLAHWLDKQRELYNNNYTVLLSCNKIEALQQLDEFWYMSLRDYIWEVRFIQLQHYKYMHGDCCVPIGFVENKPLGQWVSNQRKKFKCNSKTMLSNDRIERLNSIGFVWNRWEYEFTKKQVNIQ